MGKNFTAVFVVCLSVAALPLACGGDDDDGGGGDGTTGGKGGSSGSGTGGSATGGKGGTNTGGSATGGKGGANTGGAAPTGGTAGMGGAEGGMGGAEGGMGGEGGDVNPPTSLCERYCTAGEPENCNNDYPTCLSTCSYNVSYGGAACEVLNTAMYECHLAGSSANWVCQGDQPSYDGADCDAAEMAAALGGCIP